MKITSKKISFKVSILLFAQLFVKYYECNALVIGRRRILCTTPIGGNEETDALLDPRPNFPIILGYVGVQAVLPSLGQCPKSVQIQPPWFTGAGGGGLCPPEYYNLEAILPGLLIIGLAVVLSNYINSNRLLITMKGIGNVESKIDIGVEKQTEEILFNDIDEWNMTPAGLMVKHSSKTSFFPLFWDSKSVEALLEERI